MKNSRAYVIRLRIFIWNSQWDLSTREQFDFDIIPSCVVLYRLYTTTVLKNRAHVDDDRENNLWTLYRLCQ